MRVAVVLCCVLLLFLAHCSNDSATTPDGVKAEQGATDGAGEEPSTLPELGPNSCTVERPCSNQRCLTQGASGGCGTCQVNMSPCSQDGDCKAQGAHFICVDGIRLCFCEGKTCVAGCKSDSGCGAHQVCTNHRCTSKPCQSDSDCPSHYACTAQKCARKRCTKSAECPGGYCVNSGCFRSPGSCSSAPP